MQKIIANFEKIGYNLKQLFSAKEVIKISLYSLDDVEDWITEEQLQKMLDAEQFIAYAAYQNDKGVGSIIFGIEEEGRIWIEEVGVAKAHRRKGIAKLFIDVVIKYAVDKKFRSIFVDVDDDNYDAIKFYLSVKFKHSGIMNSYYYDNSDAILLRYDI